MGIQDLSPLLTPNKCTNKLSELKGQIFGVDLLVFLHRLYNKSEFAIDFHQDPPIDLQPHINILLNSLKSCFVDAGVRPIFYIDGALHPNKAKVNDERDALIASNLHKFHN
jgi:hypothetical protein